MNLFLLLVFINPWCVSLRRRCETRKRFSHTPLKQLELWNRNSLLIIPFDNIIQLVLGVFLMSCRFFFFCIFFRMFVSASRKRWSCFSNNRIRTAARIRFRKVTFKMTIDTRVVRAWLPAVSVFESYHGKNIAMGFRHQLIEICARTLCCRRY